MSSQEEHRSAHFSSVFGHTASSWYGGALPWSTAIQHICISTMAVILATILIVKSWLVSLQHTQAMLVQNSKSLAQIILERSSSLVKELPSDICQNGVESCSSVQVSPEHEIAETPIIEQGDITTCIWLISAPANDLGLIYDGCTTSRSRFMAQLQNSPRRQNGVVAYSYMRAVRRENCCFLHTASTTQARNIHGWAF